MPAMAAERGGDLVRDQVLEHDLSRLIPLPMGASPGSKW